MKKFYICETCGNIIAFLEAAGPIPKCCGSTMELIDPCLENCETIRGSTGHMHIPVVTDCSGRICVQIGKTLHPMETDHSIRWIGLETNTGMHRRWLTPDDEPKAEFCLCDGEIPKTVYAYCNRHGLWVHEIPKEKK